MPRGRIPADFTEPIALAVNGGTGRYQRVSGQGNFIQVADGRFGVVFQRIGKIWYAGLCIDGKVDILVESIDREYVRAAARGLRIRNIGSA